MSIPVFPHDRSKWFTWPFSLRAHGSVPIVPYDVIALYFGAWDASFTNRNASAVRVGLETELHHLLATWPTTRVVLYTMTPCGGTVNGQKPRNTPAACAFVEPFNEVIWQVARPLKPRVQVLDAHQMVSTRPEIGKGSYPPGLWMHDESHGWHFAGTDEIQDLQAARSKTPPSQAGEMNFALANRLWDVICPHSS